MKCPGQDSRYWDSNAIYEVKCPRCGNTDEFFKDESTRKCKKCGYRIVNPKMDFGCAAYCKFADQCIGELPPEVIALQDNLLKDRLAAQIKIYHGKDYRNIKLAGKVAEYAEKIAKEENADIAVVINAAYLYNIGNNIAEENKNNYSAVKNNDPEKASEILKKLNANEILIEQVYKILEYHNNPEDNDDVNYKSVFDADLIAKSEELIKEQGRENREADPVLRDKLLTESGRRLAEEVLTSSKIN